MRNIRPGPRRPSGVVLRRILSLAPTVLVVLACTAIAPPSATIPETAVPTARPIVSTPAPTAASPQPAAQRAAVDFGDDFGVVFAGDVAATTIEAYNETFPGQIIDVASVTVDFGDGTTAAASQTCGGTPMTYLPFRHVFAAGEYSVHITAAELCDPRLEVDLGSVRSLRVFPVASPATAAWPACTTYQLRMTLADVGAAAGSVAALVRLQNVSRTGCNLDGYPGLQLIAADGQLLPTHVSAAVNGAMLFPAIPVHRVALGPGAIAAFAIGYGDNPSGTTPYEIACPSARWVRIFLPVVGQFGTASGPIAPCEGGVAVSPFFPGQDWIGFR
jgi:Protein of unknown function (DUF4232)